MWAQQLQAVDTLHHAAQYLAAQYDDHLPYAYALAQFDARMIIVTLELAVLDEAESQKSNA